jgi:nitroreductase/NAD-dependent dihydropyrimidine dehydrogenase PreA subunit
MNINGIDREKCTDCLACVKECPLKLFSSNNETGKQGKVTFSNHYDNCTHCGHCVSVCPHDAILYDAEGKSATFPGIKDLSRLISYDDMLSFLKAKRSVRRYKQKPLSTDDMEAVLTAMQYAPSGTNARSWEYVIITDPGKRNALADEVVSLMKMTKWLFRLKWLLYPFLNPYVRKLVRKPGVEKSLDQFFADSDKGDDYIFFQAPCVVILHSPPYGHLAGNDAGIALTYGMLAAQTRGIGSCWIGFAQEAFYVKKKLKKTFHIPRHHAVNGVMTLGYQAVTYHRTPVRGPLKVEYFRK